MARARDPNRETAKRLYLESEGKMLLKDIAAQLGKSDTQIRKWKNLDKWDDHLKGNVTNESKSNVTNKKQSNHKKTKADVTEELPFINNDDLTDKQKLFCIYYTKYWNATKAYQKVYDSAYTTARTEGSRNLAKPHIRREIERIKSEIADGIMLDARAVLQKYIDVAFSDIGDYVEFNEYSIKMKDLSDVDTSIISEASNTEDGIKFKLVDKMKALDFLAKYTDLLNENELKQLKVEKERVALDNAKNVEEEYEDDGFIEALKCTEVNWDES